MTNNDIFRSLRDIFDLSNVEVQDVFALVACKTTAKQVSRWLKKDDDTDILLTHGPP